MTSGTCVAKRHRKQLKIEDTLLQVADLNEIMDAFPYWTPSWTLLSNTYDCAHEFWEDVFMKSFPHLGKLLKKKVYPFIGTDCTLHTLCSLHGQAFAAQSTASSPLM